MRVPRASCWSPPLAIRGRNRHRSIRRQIPNVIGVTATDENDELFGQAVRGPQVAVAAPGVDVMVPAPSETYQLTTGTSVAAAHVSGVAALLIERHPEVSAQTILEVLTSSATHLNPKGRDNLFGWGLVDPAAALAELDSRMEDSQVASNQARVQQAGLACASVDAADASRGSRPYSWRVAAFRTSKLGTRTGEDVTQLLSMR